jgi:type IV secretory pathway VirJ component
MQKMSKLTLAVIPISLLLFTTAPSAENGSYLALPDCYLALSTCLQQDKTASQSEKKAGDISNLPLIITAAKVSNPDAPVALLISGDGGWYWFEQSLANHLAGMGIPTVGIDSRKYLWSHKTPEKVTSDIESALKHYASSWGKSKFLLAGYSYGAEIVPFIIRRVDEDFRLRIEAAVLLSPDVSTDFEVHLSNMVGIGNKQNTYDVAAEISDITGTKVLAIFGEDEKSRLPVRIAGSRTIIKFIPGDHHYKFNVDLIMSIIKGLLQS